jgi:C-terminal processing protease CtpA/Prc
MDDGAPPTPEVVAETRSDMARNGALILDLRFNHGGDPSGVAGLLSHFFALGDTRHLNDLYNRPKKGHTRILDLS